MNKSKRWKVIGDIFFYLVMILLVITSVIILRAKYLGIQPSIIGYKFYVVLTGSMSPVIKPGDLVIVKEVLPSDVNQGDIITFKSSPSNNIITHRVKEIVKEDSIKFVTQGDANNAQDLNLVEEHMVQGKVVKNLSGLGTILQNIKSYMMVIIIIIVMGYFATKSILRYRRKIKNN